MTENVAPEEEHLNACFHAIEEACAQRGLTAVRLDKPFAGYLAVQLQGARQAWNLEVDCASKSITGLPRVVQRDSHELRPHVSYSGVVCISDNQGLSLDPARRPDIVAFALLAAYDLLEKWDVDAQANRDEFYNELEGYWLGLPDLVRARSAFEVDGKDRLLTAALNDKKKPARWYLIEREGKSPFAFDTKNLSAHRALYIHLDHPFIPPVHPAKVDSAFAEAIQQKLSPAQLELWAKLVGPSKNGPKRVALAISAPRPAGGFSLIGIAFGAKGGKMDPEAPVTPFTIRRQTTTYMRERGGASLEFLGKHIVVLGCGAVGSVVADSLGAAGIGRLTLVDGDTYTEDNVFRHILDPFWIDSPKVLGLKSQLERHYPGLNVTIAPCSGEEWLKTAKFDDIDGLVFAFGLPTLERSFNRVLRTFKKNFPIVFTWLEPLDLGGHSVLVWSEGQGCLDCLYRDDEGASALHARTSFLAPNQAVSRNLTGCSSVFVPYGALQSRRTGLMAAEHMVAALAGASGASYRYWVGDGRAAAAQGLRPTPWWSDARSTTSDAATRRVFGLPCRRCRDSK